MAVISANELDGPILASILHHIDPRKCLHELNLGMSEWTDSNSGKVN